MTALESQIREKYDLELTESADYLRKIEDLIRLGLMPVQDLPLLKRAFIHMQTDMFLPFPERKIFYQFVVDIMEITLGDPTINRLIRQRIAMHHGQHSKDDLNIKLGEGVELKGTPEGTLVAYANAIKNKIRAGGKPTTNDKALASAAKNELRRRRNVQAKRGGGPVEEELSYEEKLQFALEKFGITGISELAPEQTTEFFTYIDTITTPQGE